MPAFNTISFERKFLSGFLTADELVESFLAPDRDGGEVFDIRPFNGSVGFLACYRHPDKAAVIVGNDPVDFALSVTERGRRCEILNAFLTPKIFPYVFPERTWAKVVEFLYGQGGNVDAATGYFGRELDRDFVLRYVTHGLAIDAGDICAILTHPRFAANHWSLDHGWLSQLTDDEVAFVAAFVVNKQPRRALACRNIIARRIGDDVLRQLIGTCFGAIDSYEGISADDLAWLPLTTQYLILSDLDVRLKRVDIGWLIGLYALSEPVGQAMIDRAIARESIEAVYRALVAFPASKISPELKARCEERRKAEGYVLGTAERSFHRERPQFEALVNGNRYIHLELPNTRYALEPGMPVIFKPLREIGAHKFHASFVPLRPLTPP